MTNKNLYVAATPLQLINVINISCNVLKNNRADLVICSKGIKNYYNIIINLKKLQLFEEIYVYCGDDLRLSTFLKAHEYSLYQYVTLLKKKYLRELVINDFIYSKCKFNLNDYEIIFCIDKEFTKYISEFKNQIALYDEGLGSYISSALKDRIRIDSIFLYKPQIAEYYETYRNIIHKIPSIKYDDIKFINILNFIFDFKKENDFNGDNCRIIFFDQPWRYYSNVEYWYMYLFSKISKKYVEKVSETKLFKYSFNIIESIKKKNKNYLVKLHPRTSNSIMRLYNKKNINISKINSNMPWEIFFLNNPNENYCLISLFSTATCSPYLYFDSRCKIILLYKTIKLSDIGMADELDHIFHKIALDSDVHIVQNPSCINELIV